MLALATPPAALLAGTYLLPGSTHTASPTALLLFAWASATTVLLAVLRRAVSPGQVLTGTVLVGAAVVGYRRAGAGLRPSTDPGATRGP